MANIKSAKKRIKVIDRRTAENKFVRATISTYRKNFKKLMSEKNLVEADKKFRETEKLIYSAVSKGVFHQNKANRIVATMSAQLYYSANPKTKEISTVAVKDAISIEPTPVVIEKDAKIEKTTAKKTPATEKKTVKKTTEKKTVAKKDTVEKVEEKPAVKKTATKVTTVKKPATTVKKPATTKTASTTVKKPVAKKTDK